MSEWSLLWCDGLPAREFQREGGGAKKTHVHNTPSRRVCHVVEVWYGLFLFVRVVFVAKGGACIVFTRGAFFCVLGGLLLAATR